MENKNSIYSYIAMGSGLLMLLSVFLPYVSIYSVSKSLWSLESSSRFLFIILGLAVLALYIFNKKTELSYLTAGYGLFSSIEMIISNEGFSYLSVGFYFLLLSSILMLASTYLYDESKGIALVNLSVNKAQPNPQTNYSQPINNSQQMNNQQPGQFIQDNNFSNNNSYQ